MSLVLTAIGTSALLLSLGGIGFGLFVAARAKTRARRLLFSVWWVPAVAAAAF